MDLDNSTRQAIEDLLGSNNVVLFMKGNRQQPQCGFSASTVAALDMLIPDYLTVDVLQNPELREGIKAYGNWPTIPQLYVNGELIGGNDIVMELSSAGELPEILNLEQPAPVDPAIRVSGDVAEAMRRALESQPRMSLHLTIDACWNHSLSLGPRKDQDISVTVDDIEILLDRWSASRADGLSISLEETLTGTSFRFDNPNEPPPVRKLTAGELKDKLDKGEPLHLFDVRTDRERAVAVIEHSRPLDDDAAELIAGLPKDAMLVFYCLGGRRAQAAAERYRFRGYTNVHNVEGGILAWAGAFDPDMKDRLEQAARG